MSLLLQVPEENLDTLKSSFLAVKQGLTIHEFINAMVSVLPENLIPEQNTQKYIEFVSNLAKLFEEIDRNDNGLLSWDEFTNYCIEQGIMAKDPLTKDAKQIVLKIKRVEAVEKFIGNVVFSYVFILEESNVIVLVAEKSSVIHFFRQDSMAYMTNFDLKTNLINFYKKTKSFCQCSADFYICTMQFHEIKNQLNCLIFASNLTLQLHVMKVNHQINEVRFVTRNIIPCQHAFKCCVLDTFQGNSQFLCFDNSDSISVTTDGLKLKEKIKFREAKMHSLNLISAQFTFKNKYLMISFNKEIILHKRCSKKTCSVGINFHKKFKSICLHHPSSSFNLIICYKQFVFTTNHGKSMMAWRFQKKELTFFGKNEIHGNTVCAIETIKTKDQVLLLTLDVSGSFCLTDITGDRFTKDFVILSHQTNIAFCSGHPKLKVNSSLQVFFLCAAGLGLWSVELISEKEKIDDHALNVLQIIYEPHALTLIFLNSDNSVVFLDPSSLILNAVVKNDKDVSCIRTDKKGKKLYLIDFSGNLKVFNSSSGLLMKKCHVCNEPLADFTLDQCDSLIYLISRSGTLFCFDDLEEDILPKIRVLTNVFLKQPLQTKTTMNLAWNQCTNILALSIANSVYLYNAEFFRFIRVISVANVTKCCSCMLQTNSSLLNILTKTNLLIVKLDSFGNRPQLIHQVVFEDKSLESVVFKMQLNASNNERDLLVAYGGKEGNAGFMQIPQEKRNFVVNDGKRVGYNPRRRFFKSAAVDEKMLAKHTSTFNSRMSINAKIDDGIKWQKYISDSPLVATEIITTNRLIFFSSVSGKIFAFSFEGQHVASVNMANVFDDLSHQQKSWKLDFSAQKRAKELKEIEDASKIITTLNHGKSLALVEVKESNLNFSLDISQVGLLQSLDASQDMSSIPISDKCENENHSDHENTFLNTGRIMIKQSENYKNYKRIQKSIKKTKATKTYPASDFLKEKLDFVEFNSLTEKYESLKKQRHKNETFCLVPSEPFQTVISDHSKQAEEQWKIGKEEKI